MNEDNQKAKGGGGAWAIFLIVVGVILLLNNLGFLPWEIWSVLWQFWPVLLILGGLEMVLGHSSWSRLAVTILGLAVAAFIVALAITSVNPRLSPNWLERIFPNWPENFQFQPELPEELLTLRHQSLLKFN
jgi:predicted ferric reductase